MATVINSKKTPLTRTQAQAQLGSITEIQRDDKKGLLLVASRSDVERQYWMTTR